MELILSLILLVVLLLPPLYLAGKEMLDKLFFYVTGTSFNTSRADKARHDPYIDGWETPPVYDGTITIEIPAPRDQVIAYEPLLDDAEIALLDYPSRASRA